MNNELANISLLSPVESKLFEICNKSSSNTGLERNDCFHLYRNWSFGKRLVEALPSYAMSVPRVISIDGAPPEVIQQFEKTSAELRQDDMIKRCLIYTRVTGFGGLFVAIKNDKFPLKDNLTYKDIQNYGIEFYALDSLSLTNNQLSQNPQSHNFMKAPKKRVQGKLVGDKRLFTLSNGEPVFLAYTPSAYNFSGTSIFQNLLPQIQSHLAAIIGLRRVSAKAGAIISASDRGGKLGGEKAEALIQSKETIGIADNTGILSISNKSSVTFFSLQGIGELANTIKTIEYEIMIGVSDTPKTLLLDESLVNGMAEGTNDFSLALLAINSFRLKMLTPLYEFTDEYVMKLAWSDKFIQSVIQNTKKYQGFTTSQIRELWMNDFTYEYGNLIPEPESLIQEREARSLEKLQRAKELGATTDFIESELNSMELFNNEAMLEDKKEVMNSLLEEPKAVPRVTANEII